VRIPTCSRTWVELWGDELGRIIQALEVLPGIARRSGFLILAPLEPECLVGGAYLPEDAARHLRRQFKLATYLLIHDTMWLLAGARLSDGKSVLAHQIQRIPVSQLGCVQSAELFWHRLQL
jgi:hypothetical protein